MDKKEYDFCKELKRKMEAGEKTTFAERNKANIIQKKYRKKIGKGKLYDFSAKK
jgi:hypothetical protein